MDDLATLVRSTAAERHLEELTGVDARAAGGRRAPRLPLGRAGRGAHAGGPTGPHRAAPPRPRRVGDGRARPRPAPTRWSGSPSTAPATAPTAPCGAARCWSRDYKSVPPRRPPAATCRCAGGDASVLRPVPDGAGAPARLPASPGPTTCPGRRLPADERRRAGAPAGHRARLRADLQHGPALRRGVLAGRGAAPRRLRGRRRRSSWRRWPADLGRRRGAVRVRGGGGVPARTTPAPVCARWSTTCAAASRSR